MVVVVLLVTLFLVLLVFFLVNVGSLLPFFGVRGFGLLFGVGGFFCRT